MRTLIGTFKYTLTHDNEKTCYVYDNMTYDIMNSVHASRFEFKESGDLYIFHASSSSANVIARDEERYKSFYDGLKRTVETYCIESMLKDD